MDPVTRPNHGSLAGVAHVSLHLDVNMNLKPEAQAHDWCGYQPDPSNLFIRTTDLTEGECNKHVAF